MKPPPASPQGPAQAGLFLCPSRTLDGRISLLRNFGACLDHAVQEQPRSPVPGQARKGCDARADRPDARPLCRNDRAGAQTRYPSECLDRQGPSSADAALGKIRLGLAGGHSQDGGLAFESRDDPPGFGQEWRRHRGAIARRSARRRRASGNCAPSASPLAHCRRRRVLRRMPTFRETPLPAHRPGAGGAHGWQQEVCPRRLER
jgi:hypothetical protein